jgi:esterase/lipase
MIRFLILLFTLGLLSLPISADDADPYVGFPAPQANFDEHIDAVEQYLRSTQMPQRARSDVKYNLPFHASAKPDVPFRGTFLLIHGLNDSPYVFSDVKEQLVNRGFDVRAILLPGHGNTPKAQLNMSYKTWLSAARQHLKLLKQQTDSPIYAGGFSLGGVIATILAYEDKAIEGLLLFSPAFKSQKHHLLRWASLYSRYKPWVFGGMIIEDNPTKYNSIPINGTAQYFKTTQKLNSLWRFRKLDIPVLMVLSADDSVVNVEHAISKFNSRFSSASKHLIVYSNSADTKSSEFITVKPSSYPEIRMLNQSHQSVLIGRQNPLFGEKGSVLVCNGNEWAVFSACLYYRGTHWYGAHTTPSPDGVPVARVTYNPDFAAVFESFDKVFAK